MRDSLVMLDWRHPKVLTFHTVLPERPRDALFFYAQPTADEFEEQVRYLAASCAPLDLDTYLAVVRGQRPAPKRSVLVTLDDGYAHSQLAAEILARHRVPSVLFLAVDFIATHHWPWFLRLDWLVEASERPEIGWRGEGFALGSLSQRKVFRECFKALYLAAPELQRQALLDELSAALEVVCPDVVPESHRFLDWREATAIARHDPYMELGSHGLSHHDMTRLSTVELDDEMKESAIAIELHTGVRPRAVSYPDGRHDENVRAAASNEYELGFALLHEADPSDPLSQPRLPGLPGGELAVRRVLSPVFRARQAAWRWRAQRRWI